MKNFCKLLSILEKTKDEEDRQRALLGYLEQVPDEDRLWALWLLLQNKPRKVLSSAELREWTLEMKRLPDWLWEEALEATGNLAEASAWFLGKASKKKDQSLAYWIGRLLTLAKADVLEKKHLVIEAWESLEPGERFWWNRLLLGTFRIKIARRVLVKALAQLTGKAAYTLWHRLLSDWVPSETTFQELFLSQNALDDWVRPYPMVKYLDWDQEDLLAEEPVAWQATWYREGIPAQLIGRKGQVFLWSEEEEWLGDKFPEFSTLSEAMPEGTVLAGSILPFREGQFLEGKLLQERLAKKGATPKTRALCPVIFLANDLLEYEGKRWTRRSLQKRWQMLEELLAIVPPSLPLSLADVYDFENWEALEKALANASDYSAKGFLLRNLSAKGLAPTMALGVSSAEPAGPLVVHQPRRTESRSFCSSHSGALERREPGTDRQMPLRSAGRRNLGIKNLCPGKYRGAFRPGPFGTPGIGFQHCFYRGCIVFPPQIRI